MNEMKDSGIEWIGEIPAPWGVKRLKYVTKLRNEKGMFSPGADDYIGLENVRSYRNEIVATDSQYEPSIQSICRKGDVMFGRLRPYLAKVIIVPADSFCTGEFLQFSWFSGDKRFLRYFLLSPGFIEHVNASTYGTKMPRANTEFIINSAMVCPPLVEQTDIATFLDDKCAEIDSISKDIEAQIETLGQYKQSVISEAVTKGLNPDVEMKDSEIEWFGEIPKHWDIKRGKYFMSLLERPIKEDDDIITCFRDGEVTLRSNRREDGFTIATVEAGYQGIEPGDLVVHGMDGFAGAIGISDSRGKGTPALNVLDSRGEKRYFMYLLRFMAYSNVFLALATGIRVRTCDTSWKKLRGLYYLLPPLSEQQAIATFLDNKCAEIDSIIADKEEQLTILEDYKKSLIYEYVTGKKEAPTA